MTNRCSRKYLKMYSTDHQTVDSLVNVIATTEEEAQTSVKIKGKDKVVPARKVLHVQCKTNAGFL